MVRCKLQDHTPTRDDIPEHSSSRPTCVASALRNGAKSYRTVSAVGSDPSSSENGFTLMAFSGWEEDGRSWRGEGREGWGIMLCRSFPYVCSTTVLESGQAPEQAVQAKGERT